jgi:hypothetical protein
VVDAGWDATGSTNECCSSNLTPGCKDPSIEQCVCQKDGACCASAWDLICVNGVNKYGCGACVICKDPCPAAGAKKCAGNTIESCVTNDAGCLEWELDQTCPSGQTCLDGSPPSCGVSTATGDTCATVAPLQLGANSIGWTATGAEYVTSTPSCVAVGDVEGPDLVLSYTPATSGTATLTFDKPTSTRWVAIVSTGACGTLSPELACISDWSPATMAGSFPVTAGTTVYIYVRDTSSGTLPLDNPLEVTVSQ